MCLIRIELLVWVEFYQFNSNGYTPIYVTIFALFYVVYIILTGLDAIC